MCGLLFVLSFSTLTSCDKPFYEKEHVFAENRWGYADTVVFEFEIEDTNRIYNLFLDVAHGKEYGYENLYSKVYMRFPDQTTRQENISLELADNLGNWHGECSGETCVRKFNFKPNAYFPMKGKYSIVMEQYNRVPIMPELKKFKMRIEQTDKVRGAKDVKK